MDFTNVFELEAEKVRENAVSDDRCGLGLHWLVAFGDRLNRELWEAAN
jgi:hypothetical protein